MERITKAHLEGAARSINKITGNPETVWERRGDGTLKATVGNYHISYAYGGVCLHQMVSESGGVRDVFDCGHVSRRDLWNRIRAYQDGLRAGWDQRSAAS